jgi:hypothetical protein
MSNEASILCTAGNVEVPAYLVLLEKGYTVTVEEGSTSPSSWLGVKNEQRYRADSLVELLGLVSMVEVRGAAWQASDNDIDAFLQAFEPRQ